jgi:hypothetical protein
MKWPVKEVSMLYCEKCGANYNQEYHHRCDEWDIACMGKQVCISGDGVMLRCVISPNWRFSLRKMMQAPVLSFSTARFGDQ